MEVATAFAQGSGGDGGGTITSMIRDRHQAKAAYRLLDRDEVTHEAVVEGHTAEVLEAMNAPGDYLLIEDTTVISYPGLQQAEGLGPLGKEDTLAHGLWAHQTLVERVDWPTQSEQLVGLLGQQVWARQPRDATDRKSHGRGKESNHARQQREDRESNRWMAALQQAGGPAPETTWTYVADRESDIYELFQSAWSHGFSYVIRASHSRALKAEGAPEDLLTVAAKAPVHGTSHVPIQGGQQNMALQVRSTTFLRGPSRPGGALADHTLNVVHAAQCDAEAPNASAQWTLLTDLPVETLEQCEHVLAIYRRRWLVEELHKAMKTGLKVEASQLTDARRLSALVGILSVVAVFLLQKKLAARDDPEAALDEQAIDPSMLAVLRKTDPPPDSPTRRWFWTAIAKLGGYHDKESTQPGWLTLWRGWQSLMQLTRGYDLARAP
jgi:hypothetical protein